MNGLPYWIFFAVPAFGVFVARHLTDRAGRVAWLATSALLLAATGLRDNVGGDWQPYDWFLTQAKGLPFVVALSLTEMGYATVNWLSANTFGTIHLANTVCAVLAVSPLMLFCRSRSNPWLSLTVAIPYLVVVVFMGYTRQSAAIGLSMLAFMQLERAHFWRALGLVMAASLFHWAALGFATCIVALSAIPLDKSSIARSFLIGVTAVAFAWLLFYTPETPATSVVLSAKVDTYVLETESREIQSRGALIRLTLTALAGVAMLWALGWRQSFERQNAIWVILAVGSVALVPVSLLYSTLADRIGLFLLPLQLQAASVVDVSIPERHRLAYRLGLLSLYGAVLFVWLGYSDFSQYWLPYDNLLFQIF